VSVCRHGWKLETCDEIRCRLERIEKKIDDALARSQSEIDLITEDGEITDLKTGDYAAINRRLNSLWNQYTTAQRDAREAYLSWSALYRKYCGGDT